MTLIETQIAELSGPALDWVIAQIEGIPVAIAAPHYGVGWRIYRSDFGGKYSPSTDWAIGGPLIEKHRVDLVYECAGYYGAYLCLEDGLQYGRESYGSTLLIATCRAITASQLGNTVQVPKELIL